MIQTTAPEFRGVPFVGLRIGHHCTVRQTSQRCYGCDHLITYVVTLLITYVVTLLIALVCFFAPPVASPARAESLADLSASTDNKPHFALPDSNGLNVELEALRGRPVLVHFFATWCEPCRDELPALKRLVERAGPNGVAVLAISVAEVDLRVRRFLETMPVNFPVLLDRDRTVSKAWRVDTLPTTYVLDATLTPRLMIERDFAWDTIDLNELTNRLSKAAQRNDDATAKPITNTAHTGG